jgi:hypothetical protein
MAPAGSTALAPRLCAKKTNKNQCWPKIATKWIQAESLRPPEDLFIVAFK